MRTPRAYQAGLNMIKDKRAANILHTGMLSSYLVFVVARTKAEAYEQFQLADVGWNSASSFKTSSGAHYTALRDAGLLEREGTILLTLDAGGGRRPVVRMEPGAVGARHIGSLETDLMSGEDNKIFFTTTEACIATRGTVLLGAESTVHALYDYEDVDMLSPARRRPTFSDQRWRDSYGARHTDAHIQGELDRGDYKVIRIGYGDWYRPTRPAWEG